MHILCLRKSNHRYLALRTPFKVCPIPPQRGHGRPKGHLARRMSADHAKWVSRTLCSELLCRHLAYGHASDSTSAVSSVFPGSGLSLVVFPRHEEQLQVKYFCYEFCASWSVHAAKLISNIYIRHMYLLAPFSLSFPNVVLLCSRYRYMPSMFNHKLISVLAFKVL